MTSRQRCLWMLIALAAPGLADIETETRELQARLNAFARDPATARTVLPRVVTASLLPGRLGPDVSRVPWITDRRLARGVPFQDLPRTDVAGTFQRIFGREMSLGIVRSVAVSRGVRIDFRAAGTGERGRIEAEYQAFVKSGRLEMIVLRKWRELSAERVPFTDATAAAGMTAQDPPVLEHPTLGLAAYGAAVADVDGDGRMDVLSTGHDTNRLYLNLGNGKFRMVEVKSPRQATAPLFLDYDNDGDADLFLSANGEQMLLENRLLPDGKLSFEDLSNRKGIAVRTIGFSAVAGDINGDGRPDIYVTAYNNYGPVAPDNWDDARNGLPNLLFVSQPDGTFKEEAKARGVADSRWSYAAHFIDLDEDGKLDLYVANDFGAGNSMYMNRGERFVDEAEARGIRDNGYAMGVSFGDINNDGRLDLHVTRMSSKAGNRILARGSGPKGVTLKHLAMGNGLYRQRPNGKFQDVTKSAGPFPAGWAWGGGFLDIDNNGFVDLYVPNGHLSGESDVDT